MDVAASTAPGQPWQTTNDEAGWAALVAHVLPLQPRVIVLEATGGYEIGVATALTAAGLPVAIVNPRQVRDFARALGALEKTDRRDPAVLAAFAARMPPTSRPLPDDLQADLHALVTRRRQLVEMCTAERNRLPLARGAVRKNLLAHIAWLEKQVSHTDRDLHRRIEASPIWRVRDHRLQSVPGIGPTTISMPCSNTTRPGRARRPTPLDFRHSSYTLPCAPLRRRAPVAWLARRTRSRLETAGS